MAVLTPIQGKLCDKVNYAIYNQGNTDHGRLVTAKYRSKVMQIAPSGAFGQFIAIICLEDLFLWLLP